MVIYLGTEGVYVYGAFELLDNEAERNEFAVLTGDHAGQAGWTHETFYLILLNGW